MVDQRRRSYTPGVTAAKKILEEALALPQDGREELVGALSESLEPVHVTPEWERELARRVKKIEDGQAQFQDAQEHLRELRRKYGE